MALLLVVISSTASATDFTITQTSTNGPDVTFIITATEPISVRVGIDDIIPIEGLTIGLSEEPTTVTLHLDTYLDNPYGEHTLKLLDPETYDVLASQNFFVPYPEEIPEFPSYAVPVIAMLGIFFVLGRRIK